MTINFEKNKVEDLESRVRAVLGVPEEFLENEVISSPSFLIKANKYINKKIKDYEDLDESLIKIGYIYYVCYLLCSGMSARLPKQMENVNTKTVLQSIDWNKKALEMLDMCNGAIEDAIEEYSEDEYQSTFAVLSNSSEYPGTFI